MTKHVIEDDLSSKMISTRDKLKPAGYTVGMLGPMNIVGDDDVFDSLYYRTTVKCTTQKGELYVIMKEDFEKAKSFQLITRRQDGGKCHDFYEMIQSEIKRKMAMYKRAIKAQVWAKESFCIGSSKYTSSTGSTPS